MTITVTEILDALAKAADQPPPDRPPNTYSSEEIRAALRIGKEKFPKVMRPLIESGQARVVKVRKQAIDGRFGMFTAYQFVKPLRARKAG